MQCPVCANESLVMSDRQGIEIDYCPRCRGVWLDRGELDKIIERSTLNMAPQAQPQPQHPHPQQHPYHSKPYYQKKHKSWLHELFD